MRTELFIVDVSGSVRQWTIELANNTLNISHGVLGGAQQGKIEKIEVGLGGRTIEEQGRSRYYSRINDQYKKGYKDSIEEARAKIGTNAMGLIKPMLAHKFRDVRTIDYDTAYVQRKYDGNRCMIINHNGTNIAYSRNGKAIDSIDHIINDIVLAPGQTVDGELYCHGHSLQTIVSWIKRKQPNTEMLKYHMYDLVNSRPYAERLDVMLDIPVGRSVEVVPTERIGSLEEAMSYFREFRGSGYEGAIIRWGSYGYEKGKRSKSLVKLKQWHDEEFKVIDIHSSVDGWGILECILPDGTTFRVSAPGTIPEKIHVLNHRNIYLDQYVTVEYAQLTKDGIPFHPVATIWNKHD